MKLLITGSRDWTDYESVERIIELLMPDRVVNGGARGADSFAEAACESLGIDVATYPADWEKYGRPAGPIRNKQMLEEEDPDLVVAFSNDLQKSIGTRHMVHIARAANIPVLVFSSY